MKKTDHTDNATHDVRRSVAEGKGFLSTCMSALRGDSEAAHRIDTLGETLLLLGKRPRKEGEISLPGDNGERLEQLMVQHRRTRRLHPQPDGFLYILRQLSQISLPTGQPALDPEMSPEEQQKFYTFNVLVANGLSPQEAEEEVERIYSPA